MFDLMITFLNRSLEGNKQDLYFKQEEYRMDKLHVHRIF